MNKHTFINIIFAVVAILFGAPSAYADIVKGRVVDSETKEPLPDASVTLTQKYEFASSIMYGKADSLGVFYMYANGKCTIEASMLG